jgi:muramoyltetrapeptide carboxypeptidase
MARSDRRRARCAAIKDTRAAAENQIGVSRARRKPRRLVPGDTIAMISPSGPATHPGGGPPADIEETRRRFFAAGFRTVLSPHALDARGYLAGADADRAGDLQAMFTDPGIHGILCVRGGYGAHRFLDALDYALIRRHPKVFIGYSDITALHMAFYTQAEFVTFHGPMTRAIAQTDPHDFLGLLRAVTRAEPLGPLVNPPAGPRIETLVPGVAAGELIGGNAALLTALLGTPYQPEFAEKILFLEDVGDQLYRLDRKLAHLRLAGVLRQVAGIIIGECRYSPEEGPALSLRQILDDLIVPLGKPAIYGLACGHGSYHHTLPVGVQARLDATEGILSIEESAVSA